MPTSLTWLDIILAALGLYLVKKMLEKSYPPFPPGPKGLPLVGNMLDMPKMQEWITFAKWGQQYGTYLSFLPKGCMYSCNPGAISSVTILGQSMVILNSARMAVDVLDKKSSKYSDRPIMQMGGELCGWKEGLVLLPYGERFRNFRKNLHRAIGSQAALTRYMPIQEIEAHRFLQRVLAKPEDLLEHVRL
jgi:cytochrome P450